jgi:stress-induced morphogen
MEAANGKAIYDAAKGNPETLQALHNLTRVDIRQALINSGEDMGQITVSDSKYAGKSSISREASFNRLLAKGYSPEEIIKLAKGGN